MCSICIIIRPIIMLRLTQILYILSYQNIPKIRHKNDYFNKILCIMFLVSSGSSRVPIPLYVNVSLDFIRLKKYCQANQLILDWLYINQCMYRVRDFIRNNFIINLVLTSSLFSLILLVGPLAVLEVIYSNFSRSL